MDVELKIQPDKKIVLSSFVNIMDGSGSCSLSIQSGRFSYSTGEFYFDCLYKFTNEVKQMYQSLSGSAELNYHYEREYLKFEAKSMGHIEFSGEFIEYGEIQQELSCGFMFDQSYLPNFIEQLERVIQTKYS